MELTTYLIKEGWKAGEEFGITIELDGQSVPVSVSEFKSKGDSVYVATTSSGKELLLVSHNLQQDSSAARWLPIDIQSLQLANVIGEGIERCER